MPSLPVGQRAFWSAVESLLLIAFATYWFGSTGLGLAVLWLAGPGRWRAAAEQQPLLSQSGLRVVLVSQHRVLYRTEDGGRLEVYADEVSPSEWAALKRQALAGQLATGRRTSI